MVCIPSRISKCSNRYGTLWTRPGEVLRWGNESGAVDVAWERDHHAEADKQNLAGERSFERHISPKRKRMVDPFVGLGLVWPLRKNQRGIVHASGI